MFPFVSLPDEFYAAKEELLKAIAREKRLGHSLPQKLEVGAMLETPALAYAPDSFFQEVDFISIGGNDLKQFFFAADRENELVRRRYDVLNSSYIMFLKHIKSRCDAFGTRLSYCGEDAGRPLEALCLTAIGITTLSCGRLQSDQLNISSEEPISAHWNEQLEQACSSGQTDLRQVVKDYVASLDISETAVS